MRKLLTAVVVSAALVSVIPVSAWAGGSHGGGGWRGGGRWHAGGAWHGSHWHGGHSRGGRFWGPRIAVGVPFYWPYAYGPSVVYAEPPVVYTEPPAAYAAPSSESVAPAIQREVVYPHGRYVLRGDGVTTAYQWVWIPNPPPPPVEKP